MVLATLPAFPGIGEDEKTTTSVGSSLICLCVPLAIRERAANGSP